MTTLTRGCIACWCAALLGCPTTEPATGSDAGSSDAASCPQLRPAAGDQPCIESQDCSIEERCVAGFCQQHLPCSDDCHCPAGSRCNSVAGVCHQPPGATCSPCDDVCTGNGGICFNLSTDAFCSTRCNDDSGPFCPAGWQCRNSRCMPVWAGTCLGCNDDSQCSPGELCNNNSRRCQKNRGGPQLRIDFDLYVYWWEDPTPALSHVSSNIVMSTAMGTRPGQDFNMFDLHVGECQSSLSTLTYNAPFPIGARLDVGPAIVLTNSQHSWQFAAVEDDPNPAYNPNYSFPAGFTSEAGWLPGLAHTWSATGGTDVGAFETSYLFPEEFTTTPSLISGTVVHAQVGQSLTLRWSPLATDPEATMLAGVSYNVINGNVVESLTQIVCRVADSDGQITIPGSLLQDVPTDGDLSLLLMRSAVGRFSATGINRGQIESSLVHAGAVRFSP